MVRRRGFVRDRRPWRWDEGIGLVSVQTVKTHVARILAELELRDRVQAVVVAYESGPVPTGRNWHASPVIPSSSAVS